MIKCDAIKDGHCEGEVKRYGNRHFNCLSIGEYHSFCKYHYDNATWCPAHPCFNKITWDITITFSQQYLYGVILTCLCNRFLVIIYEHISDNLSFNFVLATCPLQGALSLQATDSSIQLSWSQLIVIKLDYQTSVKIWLNNSVVMVSYKMNVEAIYILIVIMYTTLTKSITSY